MMQQTMIYTNIIFSVHAHFKLVDGGRLGRVTSSPLETDKNFNGVPKYATTIVKHYDS